MKIPQLKKKPELKSCHNTTWEDNYSWIHQDNILEVLKDSSKLLPDVRKYLEEENNFTEHNLKDTKKHQKILFDEIKGRIKLDDESLKFRDKDYTQEAIRSCLLYTSPSPRDRTRSRMPSSA